MAALIAGGLASRISEQAKAARARAGSTQSLYDFSRKLSGAVSADDVVWAAVTQMQGALRRNIIFLLAQSGELAVAAAWPPDTELGVVDTTAARWAFEKKETCRRCHRHLAEQRVPIPPVEEPFRHYRA